MNRPITRLAAALLAGSAPAWAAATSLPAYETYSAAADFGANFYSESAYTPVLDATSTSGATAQINGSGYTAAARTTLGSNRAYASAGAMPSDVLGAGSFSGWYDQVTITGGSGTGTARFTVRLSGTVDVGTTAGSLGYTLGTSSAHPSQLTSDTSIFNIIPGTPWALDAVDPIATYLLGASPYYDTSIIFPESVDPAPINEGIPIVQDPSYTLGDAGMGFPQPDLILTPGVGQNVDVTRQGTLTFTYGEAFYLIGGLNTSVANLESFCTIDVDGTCTSLPVDGSGATTLDFSNSVDLVSIGIPHGATASFASGTTYNVTAVPEPGEWAMLLAGLALVGWRARRRSA